MCCAASVLTDAKFDTPATNGANANGKEKATDGEVRLLQPLARVHPAQHDTSSVPSDVHSDLFSIWTDSGRPVAYSVDAETVLYTPPKPLTHLTLGEVASAATGRENGATSAAPTVKDSDLRPVLSLVCTRSLLPVLMAAKRVNRGAVNTGTAQAQDSPVPRLGPQRFYDLPLAGNVPDAGQERLWSRPRRPCRSRCSTHDLGKNAANCFPPRVYLARA
jgi:hypothetical protein